VLVAGGGVGENPPLLVSLQAASPRVRPDKIINSDTVFLRRFNLIIYFLYFLPGTEMAAFRSNVLSRF
jgi:hypothetical protein